MHRRTNAALMTFAGLLVLPLLLASTSPEPNDPMTDSVVEVKMVDKSATEFAFEPAKIEVQRGQTVRFVMTGVMPHNVEFRETPEGSELTEIRMGPFLVQQGQTYDVVIDDRFSDGEHAYVCTPHEFMGMTGKITVRSAADR